jgi:hypothetical protein
MTEDHRPSAWGRHVRRLPYVALYVVLSTLAAPAEAQPAEAAPAVAPDALAHTSTSAAVATATTTLERPAPSLPDEAPVIADAPAEAPTATEAPAPVAAAPAPREEAPRRRAAREATLQLEVLGGTLEVPLQLALRGEGVSSFAVDRDGNMFQSGLAASPVLRLGLRFELPRPLGEGTSLVAEYEHDLPTGTWTGATPLPGEGLPNSTDVTTQLRKGWARLSLGLLHVGAGVMTSHWGLGLVANDGDHGWTSGSARFSDPRGGDVVLRAFVSSGPLTDAEAIVSLAFDRAYRDDVLVDDDTAYQLAASAVVGDERRRAGLIVSHRRQSTVDGRELRASLLDATARWAKRLGDAELTLEAEAALTLGTTTLGASREIPKLDVLQLGAALRASFAYDSLGAVLDVLYASGEPNTYDDQATGFRTDPNFETGLLLFRYVQAAHTGRGYGRATDPQLVGAPAAGIERWPTRGGLTNALVFFPRVWALLPFGPEVYGGVLVALAPETNIDPFNTSLAGGARRNALDLAAGGYWGTELDLGLRYGLDAGGVALAFGAEGGVLFPGSALGDTAAVYGGRLIASARL